MTTKKKKKVVKPKNINMHDFRDEVKKLEGGKKAVDIAQTTEVVKCTLIVLGRYDTRQVENLVNRYRFR